MYVTRPLSMYKKSPADLSTKKRFSVSELSNIDLIKEQPFPQNKSLELYHATWFYPNRDLQLHGVFFIPVLGPYGKDKG
ncbi:hypothetical protein D8674_037313 [Pyrus ussuriensis x Pyrus communis]|uniref:Uncharacterized protein n=1 Tax=Pyrus ussuriensis x Pyrus communis TaxID=2448454 RepID=A0A5N5GFE5_9ROSA|nr:hypothetical protein D8674_037313 [Pyrus ussuriensis x Pyrus communis]